MSLADTLPALYKRTSTGKIQMWQIRLEAAVLPYGENSPTNLVTLYGLLDGKKQEAVETISYGKNIGKANETTPFVQAKLEAKSQWEQKVKKGYVESLEDAEAGKIDTNVITGGILPMLAHDYAKQGHKIKYPAYIQPKLDGHRCIAIVQNGRCSLWSRTRKRITGVPHIQVFLERVFSNQDIVLDGELYNHDYRDKFEQLTSFIRQETPKPGHEVVQYWVYDIITDGTFEHRANLLKDLAAEVNDYESVHTRVPVSVVDTPQVRDALEMGNIFTVYLDYGFEGAILRNSSGVYENKRSYNLQKVKIFDDAEFEVIDVEEGKGKMAGRAMFVCKTAEGGTFRVKMVGALDDLVHYFNHKNLYIGKMLTVKYQGITNAQGVPRFPVAMRFREDV